MTSNKYFNTIIDKGDNVVVTCPYHKDGVEQHPSCSIYNRTDNDNICFGTVHCFTCGASVSLLTMLQDILGWSKEQASNWLIDNYSNEIIEEIEYLPEITFDSPQKQKLDEDILDKYNCFHPYLTNRQISENIMKRFKVGYDEENNCVTFPVWDEHGDLVMITKRKVDTKRFFIPKGTTKPVYLLNYIKKMNIDTVIVVESQINALTAWSWGHPAIALFGTGSSTQYDILKESGIRNYILCFDGDKAGQVGAQRFKHNLGEYAFISTIDMPHGKDLNDITKDEFQKLLKNSLNSLDF